MTHRNNNVETDSDKIAQARIDAGFPTHANCSRSSCAYVESQPGSGACEMHETGEPRRWISTPQTSQTYWD